MKHSLPLLAMLMASATTPLPAQDMSSFLAPPALAAQLGLSGPVNAPRQPRDAAQAAARFQGLTARDPGPLLVDDAIIASPHPVRRPVMRPWLRRGGTLPDAVEEGASLVTRAAGGGTVIMTGADPAVISGANRATIRIAGILSAQGAGAATAHRSVWQRMFGL